MLGFLFAMFGSRRHIPWLKMWPVMLAGCMMAPIYLLGWVCRPFWRFVLRAMIVWSDRDNKRKLAQGKGEKQKINPRVWLQFELRRPWPEVVPELDQVEVTRQRLNLAGTFSLLYFWNGRLEEARQAADYWAQCRKLGFASIPKKRGVLYLRSSQWTWYPSQQVRPANVLGPNDPSEELDKDKSLQEFVDVLNAAEALDSGLMTRWRNARLAVVMLDWVASRVKSGELAWPLHAKRKEKRPLLPMSIGYDYDFAKRVGRADETFGRIWHQATKLDA